MGWKPDGAPFGRIGIACAIMVASVIRIVRPEANCGLCGLLIKGNSTREVIYKLEDHLEFNHVRQQNLFQENNDDMPQHFGGRTADASAPILGAGFWKKGKQLIGTVLRGFSTSNGECYVVKLVRPEEVNRKHTYPPLDKVEKLDMVSVGSLKGFGMALQAAGIPGSRLIVGDKVQITCTGTTPSGKSNDQIDFDIQVDRPNAKDNIPF